MDNRYKNFTILETPMEFCNTNFFNDKYDIIQIYDNTPVFDNQIIVFCGICKVKNNEVIPLDGDIYTKHMIVIGYNTFTTKEGKLGLKLLVSDW